MTLSAEDKIIITKRMCFFCKKSIVGNTLTLIEFSKYGYHKRTYIHPECNTMRHTKIFTLLKKHNREDLI